MLAPMTPAPTTTASAVDGTLDLQPDHVARPTGRRRSTYATRPDKLLERPAVEWPPTRARRRAGEGRYPPGTARPPDRRRAGSGPRARAWPDPRAHDRDRAERRHRAERLHPALRRWLLRLEPAAP